MTEEEIIIICKQYEIENYTINDDMSVDVNGDVNLSGFDLTKIPLIFTKVDGTFICSHNNLTSLKGCPSYVNGDFGCSLNDLTSLENCPNYVGGDFWCSWNKLTTLEYCPKYIGGDIWCDDNELTTLQHLPINFYIGGNFYCRQNNIEKSSEYSRLFFGTVGEEIITGRNVPLSEFLNQNKNPPKKDLPRLLSELRKIQL